MQDPADICDQKQDAYAVMSEGPEDYDIPSCADCRQPATKVACGRCLCEHCRVYYFCYACDGDDPDCVFARRYDQGGLP